MKILIVSNNYPSNSSISTGIFVYNLIQQFAKLGHSITIISPQPFRFNIKTNIKQDYGEELGKVYRPKFISASAKNVFGLNTYRIGEWGQITAIKKVVKKNNIEFDVVYAHFLSNAIIATNALSKYNKPIFTAVGEYNNLEVRRKYYRPSTYKKLINKISGFIAVSPQIKERLIAHGADPKRIIIEPNAVNIDVFFPRNKTEMRQKYGLPLNKKLIIFVGRFIENKGPLKLLKASNNIDDLGLIFVGNGPQKLQNEKIVFKNKVSFYEVPELLSAADLFVLPTLHEGSCNAIIEAMACGLPIVSSNIPEIKEQCKPSFSILIDPLNESILENAIRKMFSDRQKLEQMSDNALKESEKFNIIERAKNILRFINL